MAYAKQKCTCVRDRSAQQPERPCNPAGPFWPRLLARLRIADRPSSLEQYARKPSCRRAGMRMIVFKGRVEAGTTPAVRTESILVTTFACLLRHLAQRLLCHNYLVKCDWKVSKVTAHETDHTLSPTHTFLRRELEITTRPANRVCLLLRDPVQKFNFGLISVDFVSYE